MWDLLCLLLQCLKGHLQEAEAEARSVPHQPECRISRVSHAACYTACFSPSLHSVE